MLNTISLSSDQTKLYFIDQDKLTTFDLTEKEGVTIGLIDGQLAVVRPNVKPTEITDSPITSDIQVQPVGPASVTLGNKGKKGGNEIEVALLENSQFNIGYNQTTVSMVIIGATDIISTINVPDAPEEPTGNCKLHLLDLSKSVVHLQRFKDRLVITRKEK